MKRNYSADYDIYIPRLKTRDDDTMEIIRPRPDVRFGDWTYEFDSNILAEYGLHKTSFNFFILWNETKDDGPLNQTIWLKRELSVPDSGIINAGTSEFNRKLLSLEPTNAFQAELSFFSKHAIIANFIVVKDMHGRTVLTENENAALEATNGVNGIDHKTVYTYSRFKRLLIERSNGILKIKKKLKYYETDLENCIALTNRITGALFPGDCDMLIFDDECRCRFILEFKKCTPFGETIPIVDQSFLNYYKNDKNKYIRLNILRKYLENTEQRSIPLLNVFYPTTKEQQVKIEAIERNLTPGKTLLYDIESKPSDNQRKLIAQLLEHFE